MPEILIKTADLISIAISFAGSFLLAISVTDNKHGSHQMVNGKKTPFALIHPIKARIGIYLIAAGFFVQFLISLYSW